jgi:hypothetical protein
MVGRSRYVQTRMQIKSDGRDPNAMTNTEFRAGQPDGLIILTYRIEHAKTLSSHFLPQSQREANLSAPNQFAARAREDSLRNGLATLARNYGHAFENETVLVEAIPLCQVCRNDHDSGGLENHNIECFQCGLASVVSTQILNSAERYHKIYVYILTVRVRGRSRE